MGTARLTNLACAAPQIPEREYFTHYWLGVTYTKSAKFMEAKQEFESSLFFDPAYVPSLLNLGSLHVVQGHMEHSLHYFRAVAKKASTNTTIVQRAQRECLDPSPFPPAAPFMLPLLPWT